MRRHSRVSGSLVVIVLSVAVAGCPDDPRLNIPTSPSAPTVASVDISGPDSIAPGQSAQFTVTVGLSTFVSKFPTSVRWIASPPTFLRVDASGLATGGPLTGGAAVTADVTLSNGTVVRKSKGVIVLPDGTFLMVGTVTDVELHPLPVIGARVEVTPGGLDAITDSNGFYRIYGVPPDSEVRVTADGYQPVVQTLGLNSNATQNFRLALSSPRLNLAGPYTLTIEVTGSCPGQTPLHPDWRNRQYAAVIEQTGVTLQVTLTEPRFSIVGGRGNRFSGQVTATGARFTLEDFGELDFDFTTQPNVVERLPNGTLLIASGSVATTGSAALLSGTLNGSLTHYPSTPTFGNMLGSCASPRFTLTQR